jgi:peptide-methionine (S)-S-oxide reductase
MEPEHEKALFAAGCFWGVEEAFYGTPGVVETQVGYSGGHTEDPTYKQVLTHTTGHAETVEVTFDPKKVSYEKLLEVFFRIHNPTTRDRQGPDIGSNYRSAIFYRNDKQRDLALAAKENLESSGRFKVPIVTDISKAGRFWPAEEYHQKYFMKNPQHGCPI